MWPAIGAANNAHWCDLVTRSHGGAGEFSGAAWTSPVRTPMFYPDAVTLSPDTTLPELLVRIDGSAGCTIKDSFAVLDGTAHGFRVLFEAEWIARAPVPEPAPAAANWVRITGGADLAQWEDAWREENGPHGLFLTPLLDSASVAMVARQVDGVITAGAVLTHAAEAVGVSNLFIRTGDGEEAWSGTLALAGSLFPGCPIVGYEADSMLSVALRQDFDLVGPLRVWIRD
jgi:hypothetical protein